MKWLRLFVPVGISKWEEVPNGPFPVTAQQVEQMRKEFIAELTSTPPMTGIFLAPQTTAREIAKRVGGLDDFDAGMVGLAVSSTRVRMHVVEVE